MTKVQKPKRISLTAQIVEEMERLIRNGSWKVGERIPPEPELMALFSVSRNTVREALQSLIHADLLMARPGDGTYVMGSDRLKILLQRRFSDSEINSLLEARFVLETGIAGLAAQNRTAADMKKLRSALKKRNECTELEVDLHFHLAAAAAAHNDILYDFYHELCLSMEKNLFEKPLTGTTRETEILLHSQYVDEIGKSDSDGARKTARKIVEIYAERIHKSRKKASSK